MGTTAISFNGFHIRTYVWLNMTFKTHHDTYVSVSYLFSEGPWFKCRVLTLYFVRTVYILYTVNSLMRLVLNAFFKDHMVPIRHTNYERKETY